KPKGSAYCGNPTSARSWPRACARLWSAYRRRPNKRRQLLFALAAVGFVRSAISGFLSDRNGDELRRSAALDAQEDPFPAGLLRRLDLLGHLGRVFHRVHADRPDDVAGLNALLRSDGSFHDGDNRDALALRIDLEPLPQLRRERGER